MRLDDVGQPAVLPKSRVMSGKANHTCSYSALVFLLLFSAMAQAQFNYATNDGTITITGYSGSDVCVTIPATINDLAVSSIGTNAFQNCFTINCVWMPSSLSSIGHWAFAGCTNLACASIPESVASIGDGAFSGCKRLSSVSLPAGLTSINSRVFSGCTSLTNIALPNAVLGIGDYAFSGASLATIALPHGLTNIGNSAFSQCWNLSRVSIPNRVSDLGENAFNYCLRLTNVTLGGSIKAIGPGAFANCSLNSITLPDSVTSLGEQAFGACSSLISVIIGSGLVNISQDAFSGCTQLVSFNVDSRNPAFSSADGVLLNQSGTSLIRYPMGKTGAYATPVSVTNIEAYAFAYSGVTSATISSGIIGIGPGAFYCCSNLVGVTVASDNPCYSSLDGVLFNKERTRLIQWFGERTGSYMIPASVTGIGEGAFATAPLTNIIVPWSVTAIEPYAFTAPALRNVYFQGDAPEVNPSAFVFGQPPVLCYLPGTVGWGYTLGGAQTVPWHLPNPLILSFGPNFGVHDNHFGFIISWASNAPVAVEVCTNILSLSWVQLAAKTPAMGWVYFWDPDWTNQPSRFYRVRSL